MAESKIIYVPGTRVRTLSTKVTSESTAVLTRLTMDLSELSGEDVLEYALQALAVKWQGVVRRKGAIPTSDTWKVPKPGTRQGAVVDLESALKAVSPERAKELLAILMAKAEEADAESDGD
jgi:hypothetical protein